MFVNVYEVTREFGGHEEGGWWYNWFSCVETVELTECTDEDEVILELEEKYLPLAEGNIYSVNGGVAYEILIEDKPRESETLEVPKYE